MKQQYVLLLPVFIFVRVLLNEWGPTPLYCYAITVYESIRSVIQLIYLIYRHEPRKIKHENIKIKHYDEWWICWWCNKATQKENNNKFLITVFSLECRMTNAECCMQFLSFLRVFEFLLCGCFGFRSTHWIRQSSIVGNDIFLPFCIAIYW